ncbi:MAG: aspartyl-tRNA(Asn)/glutamyl-tRNA(Gln) amidotransferase subunit C [Candidatus Paceibacteria bacterium]|jgi:aspartyl-tRNA(Asn)/glutamyl-tRNA(Gln) amidotransferase subunit C
MNEEEVKNLANLARLELTDEEIKTYGKEIGSVLSYVEKLKEVKGLDDNTRIESAGVRNVMREDENPHESGIYTEKILNEAPETQDGYIKVKKIL